MAKQISIEELNIYLTNLQNQRESLKKERIADYNNYVGANSSSKSMYKRYLSQTDKRIEKINEEIEAIKYQISVDGRKLRTAISVSKDLVNTGFIKAQYHASSQVRGWGNYTGQFIVENNSTYIKINWISKYEKRYDEFIEYLNSKYGSELKVDEYKNIIINK